MHSTTKRELNQNTAAVLEQVTPDHDVVVTERGRPRWRIAAYTERSALDAAVASGLAVPASADPTPWPPPSPQARRSEADVDALLAWSRGR